MSQLVLLSGGSVDALCDSMSAVMEEFRYHVRTAVTPTPAGERRPGTAARRAVDGPVLKGERGRE